MGDIEIMMHILKLSRRELDDSPGHNHFPYAMSGEYLVEAVDVDSGCGRLDEYSLDFTLFLMLIIRGCDNLLRGCYRMLKYCIEVIEILRKVLFH